MKRIVFLLLLVSSLSHGQSVDSLYRKADNFREYYSSMYFYGASGVTPVNDSHKFWYLTQTPRGSEFLIIDGDERAVLAAFDQQRLADSLKIMLRKDVEAYKLPFRTIQCNNNLDTVFFSIDNERYICELKNYSIKKEPARPSPQRPYWSTIFKEDGKGKVRSPDRKKEAYISEGNLWVTDLESGKSRKLSSDGSVFEYYASSIFWSPDSKKIVCCKYRPTENRKVVLISSSPRDQLQPKTEELDYVKPGDALPIRRPVLFLLDEERQIHFDIPNVDEQYELGNIKWDKSSDFFTFDFNRRGHQQFVIYAGDARSGELRKIVDEQSGTFIHYYALYQYWFKSSNELLWISERDGWRHLYLYDTMTGQAKKQLVKGEWVVKSVVHVDEKNRTVIFKGCGKDKGEDPYLEKYYLLDIEKEKLSCLTPENAVHHAVFSADYKLMVDVFSRVDMAPVVALRTVDDGKIVFKPENQPDISKALDAGLRLPEVFSAKGRDGKTDIWGIIIRPTGFDASKKYPIIEYIYAGPHDSHVPKSFNLAHWGSDLAELGFIVVQIDGMGTANRSKAFHDVCWKNLKDAGFPDRIAWLKTAAQKYPQMDVGRVGIFGSSAGGQNAMGALLFHPEFYKVAYAACGCHDNRMDKIWWNEQWMGWPVGKEYDECSNVVNAHRLQGKLMLVLGELDNNVDPSSTLQVVNELIKHNKEFEFVMLPGERHTMGGRYGERKRRDFFMRHLQNIETPDWNVSKN
ncbi:MAG: S9 family peptidase [Prolixibacteraceae bacterium]|nr:S9 family peptidase [Prolixibacteraceae bacterium]